MRLVIALAVAGAAGTLSRYAMGTVVQRVIGGTFPWGTLSVNLLGCLLFGLVFGFFDAKGAVNPEAKTVLLIGFMGAFTTFSTLAFDTAVFAKDQQWSMMLLNLLLHNVLGVLAVFAGWRAAAVVS